MKTLISMMLLATGCTVLAPAFPAEEVRVNGSIHTLAFYTGALDATKDLYDPSFDVAAKHVCGDRPYKVLEKSHKPSTLQDTPGLISASRYFWVVECANGKVAAAD